MRHHTIRITRHMQANTELVERIKRDARRYAGEHPGVRVTIKVQNELRAWVPLAAFCNHSGRKIEWK